VRSGHERVRSLKKLTFATPKELMWNAGVELLT
jgi:hypothetical protein